MRFAPTLCALCAAVALVSGCSSSRGADNRVAWTARQPLRDLNIDGDRIAPVLASAVEQTYPLVGLATCADIAADIAALDRALGPDFDAGPPAADRVVDRMLDMGGGMVMGLMPYRGVVREVSGANAAERRRTRAIRAGAARRGFLKGVGWASGCAPPAAPRLWIDWSAINAPDRLTTMGGNR